MKPLSGLIPALLLALVFVVPGCGAVRSLNSAAQPMTTFELTPLAGPGGASGPNLLVQTPSANGSVATDRIVVKPNALQVTYLGDARWVDPAPVHVQMLMIRSLGNSGRLGYVGSASSGPLPDFVLSTDIEDFGVVILPEGGPAPAEAVIRITLTILRDLDARIVGSRTFTSSVPVADVSPLTVVAGFDRAMQAMLQETNDWIIATLRRSPGA